jgi:hypothetical protein
LKLPVVFPNFLEYRFSNAKGNTVSYYSPNPHYAADNFSADTERQERAEAVASEWFNDLAAPQIARHRDRMTVARAYKGAPRWDREKAAADREFAETTVDASRIAQMVLADMLAFGEVTETTSYAFDEAKVSLTMAQAAE